MNFALPLLALLLANSPPAPQAQPPANPRERLASARDLVAKGRPADALALYLWCWDHGAEASPAFYGLRMTDVLDEVGRLASTHPPAREALLARRAAAAASLASGKGGWSEATDVAALDERLGQPHATLEVHDILRKRGSQEAREVLFHVVRPRLVETGRYAEVLAGVDDPLSFFEERVAAFDQTRDILGPGDGDDDVQRAERLAAALAATGADIFECLLGVGRKTEAQALAARLLSVAPGGATRRLLAARARRAKHPEVADYFVR